MNLWNVTIGEPIPTDNDPRLYRSGLISNYAMGLGHEVTWWTSTFDHHTRKHRWSSETETLTNNGIKLVALHGISYKKSISIQRIYNHIQIARRFEILANKHPKPDIIYCSYPDIFLAHAVVKFAKKNNIPVAIDVRDLWPDIFLEILPNFLKRFGNLALYPLHKKATYIFENCTSVIGITNSFMEWGLKLGSRPLSEFDRVFPMAYQKIASSDDITININELEAQYGINSSQFIVCFFGTIGEWFDLSTVIEAAKDIRCSKIKFVICGSGDQLNQYQEQAKELDNVIFTGWINKNLLGAVMSLAKVGLAPYKNNQNFLGNIPNKPIEYISAGIPVLTCLEGELKELITEHNCGIYYPYGDPSQLANELSLLSSGSDTLNTLSSNAETLFQKHFRADDVYSNAVSFFNEMSNKFSKEK